MPVTDEDLQAARDKVTSLNEQIAEADLQIAADLREKEREISMAALEVETARLEVELAARLSVESPAPPVVEPPVVEPPVVEPPVVPSAPEQSSEETA